MNYEIMVEEYHVSDTELKRRNAELRMKIVDVEDKNKKLLSALDRTDIGQGRDCVYAIIDKNSTQTRMIGQRDQTITELTMLLQNLRQQYELDINEYEEKIKILEENQIEFDNLKKGFKKMNDEHEEIENRYNRIEKIYKDAIEYHKITDTEIRQLFCEKIIKNIIKLYN